MKKVFAITLFLVFLLATIKAQENAVTKLYGEFKIEVKNSTDISRIDELVAIDLSEIKVVRHKFNEDAFIVYQNEKEISSQVFKDGSKTFILFVTDFKANEAKVFSVKYFDDGILKKEYIPRTYAELAMKLDAVYKDKKFIADQFQNFSKVTVPKVHTDHDAMFKYEGPGWESEKVGYRFYLDWRNTNDIFGKKVNDLVLHKVGVKDVVAQNDSYHEMQNWGMDVFKVGSSLGIGSIGMMSDKKIEKISKADQVICEIPSNGPLVSEVKTTYNGWEVAGDEFDLISRLSISAGSRLTHVKLDISDNASNITTGLAKHEGVELIKSDKKEGWQYIAMYGKQSLAEDNLGIVLFYNKDVLIKQGEDELNYFVSLKPVNGNVKYYFAAAWEQELNGVKNRSEFVKYIDDEIIKLNNPILIDIN